MNPRKDGSGRALLHTHPRMGVEEAVNDDLGDNSAADPHDGLSDEMWFPKVAVTKVTDSNANSNTESPTGFLAKTMHVRWDSLPLYLPDGDLADPEWWANVRQNEGCWGKWPELADIPSVFPSPVGWSVEFADWLVDVLPLDEKGHGRRLGELGCEVLDGAVAGLQWQGCDLILIRPGLGKSGGGQAGTNAFELLVNAIEAGEKDAAIGVCKAVGQALGMFHSSASEAKATPPDERRWNARTQVLEKRTRSATVWRAAHSDDTQGTITHGNFGFRVVWFQDDEAYIEACVGGVYHALAPSNAYFPAVRDVAAGYASLTSICAKASSPDSSVTLTDLRRAFFDGWCSTAPKRWHSAQALDTNRGGVTYWEYEQMIEHRFYHQAFGSDEPAFVTRFLSGISGMQNRMYQARTLAVGGLICFAIPPAAAFYWLFYPGSPSPTLSDIGAMGVLVLCGFALRRLYTASGASPH